MNFLKNNLFFLLLFFASFSLSQDYGNKADALNLCIALQQSSSNFISNKDAQEILDKIVSIYGGDKNFIIQPCSNINNAVAITYNGLRYILYDPAFMESITKDNYWANMSILAHEVGHFVRGHTVDLALYLNESSNPPPAKTLEQKRKQELEADEFSGFVLAKLGSTYEQASYAISISGFEGDDTYYTHPNRDKRLAAIGKGFNNVNYFQVKSKDPPFLKFFYSGIEKFNLLDFNGAIDDFTMAISKDQRFPHSYFNRGKVKDYLGNFKGALSDYNMAILLKEDELYYTERGIVKTELGLHDEAHLDYNKAISLNENYGNAYFNRGVYFANVEMNYTNAVLDFEKCIELNDNDLEAYFYNALAKLGRFRVDLTLDDNEKLRLLQSTISDLDIAVDIPDDYVFKSPELTLNKFKVLCLKSRSASYVNLNDWYSVLFDSEESINIIENHNLDLNKELTESYVLKGMARNQIYGLVDKTEGCDDFIHAFSISKDEDVKKFISGILLNLGCKK